MKGDTGATEAAARQGGGSLNLVLLLNAAKQRYHIATVNYIIHLDCSLIDRAMC